VVLVLVVLVRATVFASTFWLAVALVGLSFDHLVKQVLQVRSTVEGSPQNRSKSGSAIFRLAAGGPWLPFLFFFLRCACFPPGGLAMDSLHGQVSLESGRWHAQAHEE
jgi:hypothetical protein